MKILLSLLLLVSITTSTSAFSTKSYIISKSHPQEEFGQCVFFAKQIRQDFNFASKYKSLVNGEYISTADDYKKELIDRDFLYGSEPLTGSLFFIKKSKKYPYGHTGYVIKSTRQYSIFLERNLNYNQKVSFRVIKREDLKKLGEVTYIYYKDKEGEYNLNDISRYLLLSKSLKDTVIKNNLSEVNSTYFSYWLKYIYEKGIYTLI